MDTDDHLSNERWMAPLFGDQHNITTSNITYMRILIYMKNIEPLTAPPINLSG